MRKYDRAYRNSLGWSVNYYW